MTAADDDEAVTKALDATTDFIEKLADALTDNDANLYYQLVGQFISSSIEGTLLMTVNEIIELIEKHRPERPPKQYDGRRAPSGQITAWRAVNAAFDQLILELRELDRPRKDPTNPFQMRDLPKEPT